MIVLIWAQAHGRVIAAGGVMPWYVPEDLAWFRERTHGRTVLMGRTTWDALQPEFQPLPGRRNVVLSRDPAFRPEAAEVVRSLEEGLRADRDVWVIGGGDVYRQALPYADEVLVTEIDLDVPGDVLAPPLPEDEIEWGAWRDSRTGTRYRFGTWRQADPVRP